VKLEYSNGGAQVARPLAALRDLVARSKWIGVVAFSMKTPPEQATSSQPVARRPQVASASGRSYPV
jgi:hypothetical protein